MLMKSAIGAHFASVLTVVSEIGDWCEASEDATRECNEIGNQGTHALLTSVKEIGDRGATHEC